MGSGKVDPKNLGDCQTTCVGIDQWIGTCFDTCAKFLKNEQDKMITGAAQANANGDCYWRARDDADNIMRSGFSDPVLAGVSLLKASENQCVPETLSSENIQSYYKDTFNTLIDRAGQVSSETWQGCTNLLAIRNVYADATAKLMDKRAIALNYIEDPSERSRSARTLNRSALESKDFGLDDYKSSVYATISLWSHIGAAAAGAAIGFVVADTTTFGLASVPATTTGAEVGWLLLDALLGAASQDDIEKIR